MKGFTGDEMKRIKEAGEVLRMEDELARKNEMMTSISRRILPKGEEEEDTSSKGNLVSGSKFMEIVRCPVCFDVPFYGTRMCINQHFICVRCHKSLTADWNNRNRCPVCRCWMGRTRNMLLEQIIGASFFHCPVGCGQRVKGGGMEEHLENVLEHPN